MGTTRGVAVLGAEAGGYGAREGDLFVRWTDVSVQKGFRKEK